MLQELATELYQAVIHDDKTKIMQYMKELNELCHSFSINYAYGDFYPSLIKMLMSEDEEINVKAYDFLKRGVSLSSIFEHGGILPLTLLEEKMDGYYDLKSAFLFLDFHYPEERNRLIRKNLANFFSHEIHVLIPCIQDMLKEDSSIATIPSIQSLFRTYPYVLIEVLEDATIDLETKKNLMSTLKESVSPVIYAHHYQKIYQRKPRKIKEQKESIEYLSEEMFLSGLVYHIMYDIEGKDLSEYQIFKNKILNNQKTTDSFLYPEELKNLTQWRQIKNLSCFNGENEQSFNIDSYQEMADALGFNLSCHAIVNQIFVYCDMASLLNLDESIFNSQDGIFRFNVKEEKQKLIDQLKNIKVEQETVLML